MALPPWRNSSLLSGFTQQQTNKHIRCGSRMRAARSNQSNTPSDGYKTVDLAHHQRRIIPIQADIQLGDFNHVIHRQITRINGLQIKHIQTLTFQKQDVTLASPPHQYHKTDGNTNRHERIRDMLNQGRGRNTVPVAGRQCLEIIISQRRQRGHRWYHSCKEQIAGLNNCSNK